MRYKTLALIALLFCLLFSYACAVGGMPAFPAVVHTPTPLSAWEEEGGLSALAAGTANAPERSLTGVVLYRDKENIVLSADGATISVPAAYVSDVMLGPGDIATLSYNGMIAYQPQFNSVQKIGSSVISDTVFGEISGVEDDTLHVNIESGELYAFELDKRTVFHGGDKDSFRAGDSVMVVFDGKLAEDPKALDVTMLILEDSPVPRDRSITGVVSSLDNSQITIVADDNASYTFLRNFATEVIEPPTLKAGARVRVAFDGYAAQSPLAKEIEVLKAYATPKPVGSAAGSGTGEAALSWLPTRTSHPMAGMPFSYIYYAGYPPAWVDATCRGNCSPAPTTAPSTGTGGSTATPTPEPSDSPDPSDSSGAVQPSLPPPSPQLDPRINLLLEAINTRRQAILGSNYHKEVYPNTGYSDFASSQAERLALSGLFGAASNELIAKIPHYSSPQYETYRDAVNQWENHNPDILFKPEYDLAAIGVYSDENYDYYYVHMSD